MKLLPDSHILIWALGENGRLIILMKVWVKIGIVVLAVLPAKEVFNNENNCSS